MLIKILGGGCVNCERLMHVTQEAVAQAGIQAEVDKVSDMEDIMAFGVLRTPALVVDEQVVLAGRVPTIDEVVAILRSAG